MESYESASPAEQLRRLVTIRERSDVLRPVRTYWFLLLGLAVATAAYFGVWLTLAGTAVSMAMIIVPFLLLMGLVEGARDRFGVRTRRRPVGWVLYGIGGVLTIGLGVLKIQSVDYPSWLNVVGPILVFVALAIVPLRGLWATRGERRSTWPVVELSRPVRVSTMLIGLAIGGVIAIDAASPVGASVALLPLLLTLVLICAYTSPIGMRRVGYAWGGRQWSAFGCVVVVAFVAAILGQATAWFRGPVAIVVGVLTVIVMTVVAWAPGTTAAGDDGAPAARA
ncbi:hypothetical protein [Microbacterium gorillae]|uniref:hypothetical protein n=1 Tax=Microbacterium gorillae TaxID=1231063 RepID=UPI00058F31E4|nr:hypothetical protein [Microbacterium gorillae]